MDETDSVDDPVNSLTAMSLQNTREYVPSNDAGANQSTNGTNISLGSGPSISVELPAYNLINNNEILNESSYLYLIKFIRSQYREDLDYSSGLLDEYVMGNISAMDAMTTTMTLFVLTSEASDMVNHIIPPKEYSEYQNLTQSALISFKGYLWNMVKFYETNRREYAAQAYDNFNRSISHFQEGAKFAPPPNLNPAL